MWCSARARQGGQPHRHGGGPDAGRAFDDSLSGLGGDDSLFGHGGAESAQWRFGNDVLQGGAGDAGPAGVGGNDTLVGGDGLDKLFGGAGTDTVVGCGAAHGATGGAGADTFRYLSVADTGTGGTTRDRIADFAVGVDKRTSRGWTAEMRSAAAPTMTSVIGAASLHTAGQLRAAEFGTTSTVDRRLSMGTAGPTSMSGLCCRPAISCCTGVWVPASSFEP